MLVGLCGVTQGFAQRKKTVWVVTTQPCKGPATTSPTTCPAEYVWSLGIGTVTPNPLARVWGKTGEASNENDILQRNTNQSTTCCHLTRTKAHAPDSANRARHVNLLSYWNTRVKHPRNTQQRAACPSTKSRHVENLSFIAFFDKYLITFELGLGKMLSFRGALSARC